MSMETAKSSTTMSGKIVETVGDVIVASLEATAQISLGQGLLRVADRFLWVVEKSAQWSLPVHEINTEENGKAFGKIELVRPLPWIFFLPSLVMLRVCRLGINVGAVILGYPTLQVTGMVKFIQKGRRRLRTIKSNGVKNMRHRKSSRNKTSTPEEKSTTESTSPQVDPKRKYSEVVDLDESTDVLSAEESTEEKLERLAAADSDADDQDFDPAEEELMASDSTSSDEEEDGDDYVSDSEINALRIESGLNCIPKPVTAVGDVIPEESESDTEGSPESGPESERDPAVNMNKKSTPNKTTGEQVPETLQLAKESEDNEHRDDGLTLRVPVTPVTPGPDGENNVKYYSPINSPGDSIRDYTSPVADDENDLIPGEEQSNNTPSKIAKEPETQVDNEALEFNGKSTISGNSTDGQTATTNGTNGEKRSNYHATGKSHHNGNHAELKQQS